MQTPEMEVVRIVAQSRKAILAYIIGPARRIAIYGSCAARPVPLPGPAVPGGQSGGGELKMEANSVASAGVLAIIR